MKQTKVILLLFLVIWLNTIAGVRVKYTINDNWRFEKTEQDTPASENFNDNSWNIVNIPHTYNNLDGDDEIPGYYRGPSWYRKQVFVDKMHEGKHALLYFEGANQETEVYVNGQFAGRHVGGYTRFCFEIDQFLRFGTKNTIAIKVDNKHHVDIPPLSADFTFYGGIYRDVYLEFSNKIHIATNHFASGGVYIKTPAVSEKEATVEINSLISNESSVPEKIIIENTIYAPSGKQIKSNRNTLLLKPNSTSSATNKKIAIENPVLWDIENPQLYTLYTRIYDKSGRNLLDEVSTTFGLRWFKFDPEQGFFLNGKHRKLRGTNRHQDYLAKGNALRDEMHVRDLLLLKEMGINFLRISHYPQDPVVLEMCDKLGIVVSVEIPVVNEITESQEFLDNSINMVKEMIWQDFNHPSVIIWGYMNEVLLRQPDLNQEQLKKYYAAVHKVALSLDNTIRQEDSSRYTMMAYHNAPERYKKAKLTEIPMIMGWNLYQGWYEPDLNEFQRLLDRMPTAYPGKILLVTEYGPGVDPRLHSFHAERFDFSQEYGIIYHKHYLKEMMKRPFVAGFNVWNFNDFYAEQRIDAVPHVNNKGLTGLDRERKDTYLFYKATFSKEPTLLIGNREWKTRGGVADINSDFCEQFVPVFSNLSEAEILINGKSIGKKAFTACFAEFKVPFRHGENIIDAVGNKDGQIIRDQIRVNFKLIPYSLMDTLNPFTEINVMLGSHRYFEDREAEMIWLPEQEYKKGSWGYIGGRPYRRETNFGTMLGTDIDIYGTDNNPVFQTQRVNLDAFKADVPDGKYSIYLYWAELEADKQQEKLVYNLGSNTADKITSSERVFDVAINGTEVLRNFNPANEYGRARAIIKKFEVDVKDKEGLLIQLKKQTGEPVLNSIRIYKNN
ncbi:Beta-galactosidase [bioreactor metagenome]|uniref:Beta-galactosidase n=1 Tax=bioreactor metagenome TaxID=1076179 RepID=A0A644WDL6_9ZZZZ|nr:glycoside hydrolase family 2 TIM barrel-domain containing protein [Paludibacter sp.]